MSFIYRTIIKYSNSLKSRISLLETALIDAPEGSLRVQRRANSRVYYAAEICKAGLKRALYLSKTDIPLLVRYAKKKYALRMLPLLKQNLRACECFLQIHTQKDERDAADEIDVEILRLIPDFVHSTRLYCEQWEARVPDSHNTKNMDGLIHKTLRGEFVRSKSEALIADALYRAEIPYFYEFPLHLPGMAYPIYPDFTILNKRTSSEYYWEHFGRMDDLVYASAFVDRMNAYTDAKISLGKGLIATHETIKAPLTSATVEFMIQEFLV